MKAFRSCPAARLTDFFLLLVMSLFLLWPGRDGYISIQQSKLLLFYLLFGSYLLLMAVHTFLTKPASALSPAALWRKADFTQRCIFLYWAASVLSTLLSPYRTEALLGISRGEGLLTISLYCGSFLFVSATAKPKKWWCYVFGASMTAFCGICILQMAGYNPLGLFPDGLTYLDANLKYSGLYLGTVGNADLAAALLCLAIPVFWIALLRLTGKARLTLIIPLALCLHVLFSVRVQAGVLAVIVGTALTIPAVFPVSAKGRLFLWLGVAALGVIGMLLVLNSDTGLGPVYELRELLHGRWDDRFGNGRLYIWREAFSRVPQHLLFGSGPDTMAAAMIPGFEQISLPNGEQLQFLVDTAHNEYLNILYNQGLCALLPYLAALGYSFIRWLRRSPISTAAAITGGAVLCYCVQAFFSFSMCQTSGLFWLTWAVLDNVVNEQEDKQWENGNE